MKWPELQISKELSSLYPAPFNDMRNLKFKAKLDWKTVHIFALVIRTRVVFTQKVSSACGTWSATGERRNLGRFARFARENPRFRCFALVSSTL